MHNEERVTRMRRLLADAIQRPPPEPARPHVVHVGEGFPIEGLHRRAMIKQLALAGARYGLQGDIEVFVALAGCHSLGGLSTEHLRKLSTWCAATMDRMATGSESPDAPAAF